MAIAATTPVLWHTREFIGDVLLESNDEHFPLMLARTVGPARPSEVLRVIREFDDASARARAEGRTLVTILDASQGVVPDQLNRDILMDWLISKRDLATSRSPRIFVVAPDTLVRGFIASLRWTAGRNVCVDTVPTIEAAIERACAALEHAREAIPEVLAQARAQSLASGS